MVDFLFGEGQYGLRFLFAFIVVLGLIGLTAWLVRRFGADRLGTGNQRGRQPRLAVIDAAAVDGRRRLILIRRDNVEHLLMIGGPTDVVVEANIVRAAPAREQPAPRQPAATEALPRAVALNENNTWPLQPEPTPLPTPRPVRERTPPPQTIAEEVAQWQPEPEPVIPPPRELRAVEPRDPRDLRELREPREVREPRQPRPVDPLAGLAAELSRQQPQPEPIPMPPPRPVRERTPPQPAAADPQFASPADQNLAEMAQRLEAALRRPGAKDGRADAKARPPAMQPVAQPEPKPRPVAQQELEPQSQPDPETAPVEEKPARSEIKREPKAAPQGKSLYDSLEQEMASLLGRPNKS